MAIPPNLATVEVVRRGPPSQQDPSATMHQAPSAVMTAMDQGFYTQNKTVYVATELSVEQQQEFDQLYAALTSKHQSHQGATIDLKRGYLHKNGIPIYHLDKDPNSEEWQNLVKLRTLFYQGARYHEIAWPQFQENDRAALNDPLPFQQRGAHPELKEIQIDPYLSTSDRAKWNQSCMADWLQKGVVSLLDRLDHQVAAQRTIHSQSRRSAIASVREKFANADSLPIAFAALHPPPSLNLAQPDQMQRDLEAYQTQAKQFLTSHMQKAPDQALSQPIDELAKELALTACKTQAEYDRGCTFLQTTQRKTTPEFFIMRLAPLLADPNQPVDPLIDQELEIAFGSLNSEDRESMRAPLKQLAQELRKKIQDQPLHQTVYGAQFSHRKEHLDISYIHNALSETLSQIADSIKPFEANGTSTGHDVEIWAPIDRLKERFANLALKSTDPTVANSQEYGAISTAMTQIVDQLSEARGRLVEKINQAREVQTPNVALTNQMVAAANQLNHLIERQTKLARYLSAKNWNRIEKRFRSPITLGDV